MSSATRTERPRSERSDTHHIPAVARPRPTPQWWRDGAATATWLSLLVVVALWVRGRGLQSLGTSEQLTSLGRLAGLIAADLLLIQVLLMARIPAVERSYGQDELARRHRLVGFASINLLLAHVVLIILGYAATGRAGLLSTTWNLVTTYPGMLLATAATALLTMVAVTSMRAARKRLRYESWHLLHLYAYLGVGLSIPHELWTGADFLASRLATLYWWSLYAAALGAVLGCRVGLPLYRSLRHRLVVDGVVREGPDVVSVYFSGRAVDRLPVRAGQFFVWRFLDGPGWTRGNPYSLSASPWGNQLRITVKDLGAGSARLADLKPGTRVLIEGPYGRLTQGVQTQPKVLLMASGIGITPLRALLDDIPVTAPGDVALIYRARTEADLVFRAELDEFARQRGTQLIFALGPRMPGRRSWLPESAGDLSDEAALRQLVPDVAERDVFICGADPWMNAVQAAVRKAGTPAAQIHLERFTW